MGCLIYETSDETHYLIDTTIDKAVEFLIEYRTEEINNKLDPEYASWDIKLLINGLPDNSHYYRDLIEAQVSEALDKIAAQKEAVKLAQEQAALQHQALLAKQTRQKEIAMLEKLQKKYPTGN